ncbi:MAG: HEAT repeat domain-containing protein [Alphaproteobacteria bacterium]|nr:HEAT repeat domain-containing protein [Alphaproteobacteria bacterium]
MDHAVSGSPSVPVALERVVARYRRDVHQLGAGAPIDALAALEVHLGRRLPLDLRRFLQLHNGVSLFRGALTLRSTSEITTACASAPMVVLFADGRGDVRWAFAESRPGVFLFGRWTGEELEPVYASFVAWLDGEIAVTEARLTREEERDVVRQETVPDDPVVVLRAARTALEAGRPDEAEGPLLAQTRRDPNDLLAWQLLGDALSARDRQAARQAWLQAFRRTRFPLAWPGAPCLAPEVLRALALAFGDDEAFDRELERFLDEQVADVTCAAAHALVVAAAAERARLLVRRGQRSEARVVLTELVSRCHAYTFRETPWTALVELVHLEIGLGHHDEAEALIRRLRAQGPANLRATAHLLLAEIAVLRQEPWAEDVLDDASEVHDGVRPDEITRLQLSLLRVERAVRQQRPVDAARAADGLDRLARRVGMPRLEALTSLALGDVKRLRNAPDDAREIWEKALTVLGDRDAEVRARLLLRLADLAMEEGNPPRCHDLARAAAATFHAQELPVREAWALLRLARLGRPDDERTHRILSTARERFFEADLAAGVAAVDSLAGDPGASLAWHLERATAQARARHDAQRSRPPYERSDADRPERRLGAHRLAIAACGVGVVQALSREMDAAARAAQAGRGRPTDPPVLRYLAAVDLLSGHPSYEAAAVLLEHLLERGLDGLLLRGLQGAIARSPNAALVDGLLRCIETPHAYPATSVAAAAELLGLRREPVATRPLLALLETSGSPVGRRASLGALGRIGNRSVVDALLPALDDPHLAEAAALSLLMLGDRRGVDFHARALIDARTDLSGSPGEIVGRYGGPDHLLLLIRGAEGEGERALGALQGLGLLGDSRGLTVLLRALQARERRVVEVASGALTILSGRVDDPAEPGIRHRWNEWFEKEGKDLAPGLRHRYGKPMDAGLLLDRMEDPDPYVRRTAYDELVITSGQTLPFDADGPWRVQVAHLRTWRRWWAGARHKYPSGRWVLDGEVVA